MSTDPPGADHEDRRLSLAEVKATFSARVREAEHGEPLVITRHGTPVAALVGADDYAELRRLRAAGPEAGLASVAGGWEGSEELVARILERRRSRGRSGCAGE